MPNRTTVTLPLDLKRRAMQEARKEGISLSEYIRGAVQQKLGSKSKASKSRILPLRNTGDRFLDNLAVHSDEGPTDLSTRFDEILYESLEREMRSQRKGAAVKPGKTPKA